MSQSESIKELAKALAVAQGSMRGAHRDSVNPFYKSKYADLESVWEAIREPLSKNNLAITQTTDVRDGSVFVVTTLMHQSGEWINGIYPVVSKDLSAQALGSAMSFSRRYALAAIVGVYQTDDDGNDAQQGVQPKSKPNTAAKATAPHDGLITDPQLKRLFAIVGEQVKKGTWTELEAKEYIYATGKVTSTKDLKQSDYERICEFIEHGTEVRS